MCMQCIGRRRVPTGSAHICMRPRRLPAPTQLPAFFHLPSINSERSTRLAYFFLFPLAIVRFRLLNEVLEDLLGDVCLVSGWDPIADRFFYNK